MFRGSGSLSMQPRGLRVPFIVNVRVGAARSSGIFGLNTGRPAPLRHGVAGFAMTRTATLVYSVGNSACRRAI